MELLKDKPPFTDAEKQQELLQRLRDNHFKIVEARGLNDWPIVRLREFIDPDALAQLLDTLTWLIDEIRSSHVEETTVYG